MVQNSRSSLQIDLNEFKLHLRLKNRTQLTLHFDSPSRSFYLSVIALVVNEMKKSGKIKSIPLQQHLALLALLNETIGDAAGSSDEENLLHRIYRKWKDALPNLEEAPLFKVLGKKKEAGEGTTGKVYSFADAEKDEWANLFEYLGSNENVKLKFALDKIGVGLNETSIVFGDSFNEEAWEKFISSLKKKEEKEESAPVEETPVPEPPAVPISAPQKPKISWLSRYRWVVLVVVIGVVTGAIWKIFLSPAVIEVASVDRMKFPLPEEPSIAVLPFVNLSQDPKQEFLCDGMAEAIITALSRVPRMFVISRNSTFTYKGKAVKVRQVSEELGVRYVLEGSVQRSGDRIRIYARLIDALSGGHLWAENYDREVKDVFAVQDDVTLKIIRALQVKLTDGESPYVTYPYKGSQNLDCYLKGLEALKYVELLTLEGNDIGQRLIKEALSLCPDNAFALCLLAKTYYFEIGFGKAKSPKESLKKAIELAQKAISLDNGYAYGHAWLGYFYLHKGDHDKAMVEIERALALSPSSGDVHMMMALILTGSGRPEEAIPMAKRAIRLNPFCPTPYFIILGLAYRWAGQFDEAVSAYKNALQRSPDSFFAHLSLAALYIWMGREKEARDEASEVLKLNPKFSLDNFARGRSYYKDQSQADKFINALRKAGLK
jgi:adenylate cyclase